MTFKHWCEKVVVDPDIKGGNPCFPGTRVTVAQIASLAKQGMTYSYFFSEFPFLKSEDIRYAVIYVKRFCAV
jgi:uncharacterized protein (DUF433 family)